MERTLLANLAAVTKHFLVISWAKGEVTDYHLNPKPREDVIALFQAQSCWEERAEISSYLRSVSTVSWIKENVLVFQKLGGSCQLPVSTGKS